MGVTVLHPHDCSHKNSVTNRRRRSPPRHRTPISHPPPPPLNNTNPVRILKCAEDITVKIPIEKPDLKPNRQIGSDPVKISDPIRIPNRKLMPALFYAGPVTSTSPPPSEVPLPAFFAKKNVSDATNDLIRILRLDIA
ncbi:unnamed protein product [Arabidopsis lyrata]|uniref:Uncharacterized protein n=1 Tax=Arabidopsis lyrata subsp. lyrata TaxID=81972 RepID=D7LKL5_ARALL|nr:uncharacterized protein LOC9314907 [Arabidopsis lyrata subsp. lyrata]EFH55099.1 hypothetical protein ARALYDRAFT_901149 [Arabidopsis lyrata subsp. lyrata]CAH8263507.1 unnamed protein product [Arabidopsis lyrata]|eukprot:XP_002878840.1 uncharacterized protein LOC9314907 [Arabidopsis lyrata subsp. lyrata]